MTNEVKHYSWDEEFQILTVYDNDGVKAYCNDAGVEQIRVSSVNTTNIAVRTIIASGFTILKMNLLQQLRKQL